MTATEINQNDALACCAKRKPMTPEQEYAGDLSDVNMTEDLSRAARRLAKIRAKRSGLHEQTIYAALETLSADERLFLESLSGIRS